MIVDAWMQHPEPGFIGLDMFASLRRWMGLVDGEPIVDMPLEWTLAAMDSAGVDKAQLSGWWGPSGPLLSNDSVAEAIERFPSRFFGACSVPLNRPMEAVREIRQRSEQGFKAVRVLPWLWDLPPDDRRYYPIYSTCVELGLPFCLQVGHTGPLAPSEPGRPIPYLDRVALDFPELVIVGGHIGFPWTAEMISLATKYPNVYIDTSAYKPSRYPQELVAYMRAHGRYKVLFGSNWPMLQPAQCVEGVDLLGLDAEARALFLGGNAARVFGL